MLTCKRVDSSFRKFGYCLGFHLLGEPRVSVYPSLIDVWNTKISCWEVWVSCGLKAVGRY